MPRAAQYKGYAADCLRLAETRRFRDSDERILLVEMAAMWQRLAERAEALAEHTKVLVEHATAAEQKANS